MKKKIIIPVLHLSYGGIEKAVTSLANELVHDYAVEIISFYQIHKTPPYKLNNKIKVKYLIKDDIAKRVEDYKLYVKNLEFLKLLKALYRDYFKKLKFLKFFKDSFFSLYILIFKKYLMSRAIKNTKGDIYISSRCEFNKIVSKHATKGALTIAWEHNHHHNIKSNANKVINSIKYCDYLVTVSEDLQNFYEKECALKNFNTKVVWIPNFLENIPSNKAPLNNSNIINVGRLSNEKGQLDLINVFDILHRKNSEVVLYLVGDGADYPEIEKEIINRNLANYVHMTGFKSGASLEELYLNSSLFVMTSFTESFGLVLIEAMSYGIPCLAFDSAEGAREIISNNYNGFLIKNRNEHEMASKILELLDNKKELKRLSSNALKTSLKYTKESVMEKWENLLNQK